MIGKTPPDWLTGLELPPTAGAALEQTLAALVAGRADAALDRLDALPPSPARACLKGVALSLRGDLAGAIATLESVVADKPEALGPRLALARALERTGALSEAVLHLESLLALTPTCAPALAVLARCAARQDALERALTAARHGLELEPDHPEILQVFADVARRLGSPREAITALQRVVALLPRDAECRVSLGQAWMEAGQPEQAQAAFEEALNRSGESTGALAGLAELLAAQGRYEEAYGHVLRALSSAPERADLHALSAQLSLSRGEPAAAESAALTAFELKPALTEAGHLAIKAALLQRRFEAAIRYAHQLNHDAESSPRLTALTLDKVLAGRADEALMALTSGDPGRDPWRLFATGVVRLARGEAALALELFGWARRVASEGLDSVSRLLPPFEDVARRDGPRERLFRAVRRLLSPHSDDTGSLSGEVSRLTGPLGSQVEVALSALLGEGAASQEFVRREPEAEERPRAWTPEPLESVPLCAPGEAHPHLWLAKLTATLHQAGLSLHAQRADALAGGTQGPLVLALLGAQGAGKTTLLHALLGKPLLPASARLPIRLRYGRRPQVRAHLADGRHTLGRLRELPALLGGAEAPSSLTIELPVEALAGLELLKVPAGLESLAQEADAVIWLVGADQPLTRWEEAAAWLALHEPAALAIVSRADRVPPAALEARLVAVRRRLGSLTLDTLSLAGAPGLAALAQRDQEGVLQSGLLSVGRTLKGPLLDAASSGRARRLARQGEALRREALAAVKERLSVLAAQVERLDHLAEQLPTQVTKALLAMEPLALAPLQSAAQSDDPTETATRFHQSVERHLLGLKARWLSQCQAPLKALNTRDDERPERTAALTLGLAALAEGLVQLKQARVREEAWRHLLGLPKPRELETAGTLPLLEPLLCFVEEVSEHLRAERARWVEQALSPLSALAN